MDDESEDEADDDLMVNTEKVFYFFLSVQTLLFIANNIKTKDKIF